MVYSNLICYLIHRLQICTISCTSHSLGLHNVGGNLKAVFLTDFEIMIRKLKVFKFKLNSFCNSTSQVTLQNLRLPLLNFLTSNQ